MAVSQGLIGESVMNRNLNTDVFPVKDKLSMASALDRLLERRVTEVNAQDVAGWDALGSLDDWEACKRPRIEALERSLGTFPEPEKTIDCTVTGTIDADGYAIDKLVFESRSGIVVTANVFRPSSNPTDVGILLVHSHHNARAQPELQDMGAMWARVGCTVLVMDQFAYGERREHVAGPRHDYWNRYNTGVQLQLIGDSLMGWMVWDLRRGIDVLEQQYKANRVVMMGSVAGGGDPCAVTAAFDDRVALAIPFNFGGPQPETAYPLPDDAGTTFNYLGTGGWEMTRNLAWSGRDGFLPWVILGAIAPRHLIYAHEFGWDRERDPVWKRLQRIYEWYDAEDNLDYTHGYGLLKGRPPESSHCNNVGGRCTGSGFTRRWNGGWGSPCRMIVRIGGMKVSCCAIGKRLNHEDTKKTTKYQKENCPRHLDMGRRPYFDVIAEIGEERAEALGRFVAELSEEAKGARLREEWTKRLGDLAADLDPQVTHYQKGTPGTVRVERFGLQLADGITLPVVLMWRGERNAMTVLLAQQGKAAVVRHMSERIEALLQERAVCLVDVRGTGEIGMEEPRGARSKASGRAATALMVGDSILGMQIRDLRSVIGYLRTTGIEDIEIEDVEREDVPLDTSWPLARPTRDEERQPGEVGGGVILAERFDEPMGGIVGYLTAFFEDGVTAGEMPDSSGQLRKQIVDWPMDAVVPGLAMLRI